MMVISILIKASLLIGVAASAEALSGRRLSAAARHLIWTLAIVGLLLLPLLSVMLPAWTALTLTAPTSAADTSLVESPELSPASGLRSTVSAGDVILASEQTARTAPVPVGISWPTALLVLYAAGMVLLLARLIAERVSIEQLARRATPVSDTEWIRLLRDCAGQMGVRRTVRLLQSGEQTMPMAFGTRHAAILVPAIADTWPEDRRRAVLLHELAHVARYDCLTQMLAAVACACYWVHPGAWWMAKRLRVERELACDDCVLSAGADARDYAGHLLELAYTLGHRGAPALAVSMAGARQLEGRMLALLDAARNRATPALRSRLAGFVILAALLVPIAAATTAVVSSGEESVQPAVPGEREGQAASASAQTDTSTQGLLPGTWEIRPTRETGIVHLQLREEDGYNGSTIDVESLNGLEPGQLAGAGPVQFTIRRDAGTFSFEGVVRNGVGAGTFSFSPSAAFSAELTKRGFEQATASQQRLLARENVGFAFLDELNTQRYERPALAQLVRMAEHGVSLSYLREMGRLGYRLGRAEALVELRQHDVTPQFISGLAASGLTRLSVDDLLRARDHDVRPQYVSGLRALGYRALDLEELIELRSHDVGPEYISGLRALGYDALDPEELIRLRTHDVSPEYIRAMSALGYQRLLPDLLVRLRTHDVQPKFVQALQGLGYSGLGIEELVDLRSHDVQPRYVEQLRELGYSRLSVEDLTNLRSHGIQPDDVRRANERAGTRLPVDRLTSSAARGWR